MNIETLFFLITIIGSIDCSPNYGTSHWSSRSHSDRSVHGETGRRKNGHKLPLKEDKMFLHQMVRNHNKNQTNSRLSHCTFGNQTFQVDDRWKPNLGPPFGLLVCMRCECFSLHRKNNRTVTRVKCKNMKSECPKLDCDEPILLPDHCCKSCPGDEFSKTEDELISKNVNAPQVHHDRHLDNDEEADHRGGDHRGGDHKGADHKGADHRGGRGKVRQRNFLEDQEVAENSLTHKCYYEGQIFEDGSQWKAQHQDCQMCSCQMGRIRCDEIICPSPSCSNPVSIPGECCSYCEGDVNGTKNVPMNGMVNPSNSNSSSEGGCYFEGDKRVHLAGTKWHPYLPPFGFDLCSTCTCLIDSLVIECSRSVSCPPLTCAEKDSFRENPMDCCKRCPVTVHVKSMKANGEVDDADDTIQGAQRSDSSSRKGPNDLLAEGGCKFKGRVYPNGDSWHPTVQPFGEVKCVNCSCKDSVAKCLRTKCPRLSCTKKVTKPDECCPLCANS